MRGLDKEARAARDIKIVNRYRTGKFTMKNLADMHGLAIGQVSKVLDKAGVSHQTKEQKDNARWRG